MDPGLSGWDPSSIDEGLDCRAATFENPTGARGSGGATHGGRKGAPSRVVQAGERVVLADVDGPGTVRHIWMTFPPAPPDAMRAMVLEVYYDGADVPSVSVPCLDFFGLPHGRPVPFASALTSAAEGRGFNTWVPLPFDAVRIEFVNGSARPVTLYYQVDYTLGGTSSSYLHAAFRRENPTVRRRDFVICDGLEGPGRFLGCNVGVRIVDAGDWYGEGEVKVYRDGDRDLPTICGTGLEDYVGSAWGMGAHHGPYGGAPVATPEWVSFYRWHLLDPIMFTTDLRVTIQQIGAVFLPPDADLSSYEVAGAGWARTSKFTWGIVERVDDYCATAYVYCRRPQPVSRVVVGTAVADIERRPGEEPHPMEAMFRS